MKHIELFSHYFKGKIFGSLKDRERETSRYRFMLLNSFNLQQFIEINEIEVQLN